MCRDIAGYLIPHAVCMVECDHALPRMSECNHPVKLVDTKAVQRSLGSERSVVTDRPVSVAPVDHRWPPQLGIASLLPDRSKRGFCDSWWELHRKSGRGEAVQISVDPVVTIS